MHFPLYQKRFFVGEGNVFYVIQRIIMGNYFLFPFSTISFYYILLIHGITGTVSFGKVIGESHADPLLSSAGEMARFSKAFIQSICDCIQPSSMNQYVYPRSAVSC